METTPAEPDLTYERERVLALAGSGRRVLEVGAHDGHFSRHLLRQGCHVTALERSPDAAALAQTVASAVLCGDFEHPAFRNSITDTFDVILFMHVLEHFVDPWTALRSSRPLLRPGGSIVILLPNVGCWRVRRDLFFNGRFQYADSGIMDRTHLRFFTLYSALELIRATGYQLLQQESTDVYVPLESRIRRLLSRYAAGRWRTWMLRRFPNLCTQIFLFHVRPAGPVEESLSREE